MKRKKIHKIKKLIQHCKQKYTLTQAFRDMKKKPLDSDIQKLKTEMDKKIAYIEIKIKCIESKKIRRKRKNVTSDMKN